MNDNSLKVIEVDINEILPNRFQPRIQFDEEKIIELSDSIKEHGVIQPIVVRTIGDKYEIIAGERRYKASVLAGKETVPVIIKNLNDKDSAEIALIENIQRKNLTPIEEALSYKKILDMGYLTQENLAVKLGKSQSSVANKIRLLNLSDEVQEALLDNKISERHARSLLRLKSMSDQTEMLNKIISERLTVRKTDEEIDKKLKEKGEINMNNEMTQNIVTQPGNTFDVFGGQNTVPSSQPSMPTLEPIAPVAEVPQMSAPTNMFESVSQPEVPSMPTLESIAPVAEVPQIIAPTNMFGSVSQPEVPSMPIVEPIAPVAEMPTIEPAFPSLDQIQSNVDSTSLFTVPNTSPIIEAPVINENVDNNDFSNLNTTMQTPLTQPENIIPEPIIITDYSKQYDPIMPNKDVNPQPKVDFKEIVTAIRECSSKIEKFGFKIEVEEYDLSTLYQVIFKIEK